MHKENIQYLPPNVHSKHTDFHEVHENKQNNFRIIRFNDKKQSKTKSNHIVTARYGILSFIPLFFIEQLRCFANQYLLFISTLQQIPDASPLGRFTTVIPLSVILVLSAVKSIIEDIVRHKADYEINHKCVDVLRNNALVQEKWNEIGVGDIVRVENNSIFPADLVLLSSSELREICYVETTSIDGEINFKIKQSVQGVSHCKELKDYINLNGIIECELPNKSLYNFFGRLTFANNSPIPLDNKQFLLRGSVLRNTKWIYGVVTYTGHETKLMQNQTIHSSKQSKVDNILNLQTKIIILLLFLLSFMCSVCCTWWTKHNKRHWYLDLEDVDVSSFVLQIISFFILFHNTIPIPLQGYIKLVRLIQAWFINNDIEMYHEESNTPAKVRSSNLNDELGKVKYIFSDKTGTLTNNEMKLGQCSIAGELYKEGSQSTIIHNAANHSTKVYILEFFRIMTVCHTVIPEKLKYTDKIMYNSSSPDELALVVGCQQFGFTFHSRNPKSISITALDSEECYEILNILEFTSARKKMSVIVRTPDSKIKLYCKGADTAIFKCLSKTGKKYKKKTLVHLNNFARSGYRTLCFAYVNISESFYEKWEDEYRKASTVLQNRDTAISIVADKIEKKLKLIGVTAIENKLQDNVPKTIRALMCANIKIWVLTGDKQETVINIGLSANIITKDSPIIIFNETNLMELKKAIQKQIFNLGQTVKKSSLTLVINGRSLKHALSNDLRMDFLKLCTSCKSVMCCRISPKQKEEIVDMVTKYTNEITLAIGDGANDVPMLQKASIGVGVSGFGELQAANASDYSIAQFQYLPKLLFVHGAWSFERISKMIYFCHYKNICFYALQLWFAMYSGWSGQVLFDKWIICTFNVLFTAALPLALGLFRTTSSSDTRLKFPHLYSRSENLFNNKMLFLWILNAVFHSILLFWICIFIMKHGVIWTKGRVDDDSVLGNVMYTCTLVVICLKAGLHTHSWSFVVHLTIWISILSWVLFIFVYSQSRKFLSIFAIYINSNGSIFHSSIFWIILLFTTIVVLIFDLAALTLKQTLCVNERRFDQTKSTKRIEV